METEERDNGVLEIQLQEKQLHSNLFIFNELPKQLFRISYTPV